MRPVLAFVILAALLGVGPGPNAEAGRLIAGTFELIRRDETQWTAHYRFDDPVAQVRFHRPPWAYQQSAWELATDDLELVAADSEEGKRLFLRSKNGAPIQDFSIGVRAFQQLPSGDYYAFSGFSGGGMSVYAGYFDGAGLIDGKWRDFSLRATYRSRAGETVITREADQLTSQFVYFGPDNAVRGEGAILIVDEAIPTDIRDRIQIALPDIDRRLAEMSGFAPRQSPYLVMIAGAGIGQGEGYSRKGGALEGQLLFTYKGDQVIAYERADPYQLPLFVAHELIHLWQYDLWPALGEANPWVHEGQAEALALDLMKSSGGIPEAEYNRRRQGMREACLELLTAYSVDGGPKQEAWDVAYRCGAVIHWLLADGLERRKGYGGTQAVWRDMARWPETGRRAEGKAMLYAMLALRGFSDADFAALDAFLATQHRDPAAALVALEADFLGDEEQ